MYNVKRTPEFDDWIAGIKDSVTVLRLNRRLDKVERGLLGDVEAVGDGVFEMCLRCASFLVLAGVCITLHKVMLSL